MDPMIGWLTSMFGPSAPDVAAGMGIMPPTMGPTVEQMNGVAPAQPGGPTSVWDPVMAQGGPGAPGATPQGANPLATALRGMAPPQVPAAQRVGTPSAPRTPDIKGGELLALLLAQGDAGVPGGRKINPLPGTLGQALNVPRY